jgi:hypothetical protein
VPIRAQQRNRLILPSLPGKEKENYRMLSFSVAVFRAVKYKSTSLEKDYVVCEEESVEKA